MMKKYILFVILLIFPLSVSAIQRSSILDYDVGSIFEAGEKIPIYYPDRYNIYINDELVDNFIEDDTDSDLSYLPITNRVVIKRAEYSIYSNQISKVYLEEYDEDAKVYCYVNKEGEGQYIFDDKICDDYLEEGRYYEPGIIIYNPNYSRDFQFYDLSGNFLRVDTKDLFIFPEIAGENMYWKFTTSQLNGYGVDDPIIEVIEYLAPSFELECNPKSFYYGEKSSCSLYINSDYNLEELSFDFKPESFEVQSVSLEPGVNKGDGNGMYNYEITNKHDQSETRRKILTFNVSGTKNTHYEDDLKITNIRYVDGVVLGEFKTLDGTLEILASKDEKNPNTSSTYIPVFILLVSLTICLYFFIEIKRKGIN